MVILQSQFRFFKLKEKNNEKIWDYRNLDEFDRMREGPNANPIKLTFLNLHS